MNEKTKFIFKMLNMFDVVGISLILIVAFYFQFVDHELPCPLCLLQRLGILAIAFGFMLNIRYEVNIAHYGASLIAAVITGVVSLRQVTLHLNDAGYGSTVFGLHMYTWVFVLSLSAVLYIAIVMSFSGQYRMHVAKYKHLSSSFTIWVTRFYKIAFYILLIVLVANVLSLLFECGFNPCPDDPVIYVI